MALSSEDHFDTLPDAILLHILNKLCDVKALGQCSTISKRFNSLALQAENIVVKVDCINSTEGPELSIKPKATLSRLLRLLVSGILRPLQALLHYHSQLSSCCIVGFDDTTTSVDTTMVVGAKNVSQHSPSDVLKNFKMVKHLRIELPESELGVGKDVFLRWRAVFGSTLETCVILAGSCTDKAGEKVMPQEVSRIEGFEGAESNALDGFSDSFFTDGGLKLRVAWTISALIAASARHYLLQEIINEHLTLETLILADADGQGTICMHKEQLQACRKEPILVCASSKRTQVPALNMKLWYAPFMNLTSGAAVQGATLVTIQPRGLERSKEPGDGIYISALEEPFQKAAFSLARRKTYLFEMNSF